MGSWRAPTSCLCTHVQWVRPSGASVGRPLRACRAPRPRRSLPRRSSSLRDARRRLWKGRSDRSRGEKLWPLTAMQPSFRLKPSRSIGSGAGSSATKAQRLPNSGGLRMNSSEPVGTIRALWRFPVKSMLGDELDAADLTEGGVVGDRAYAIRDRETGKVASAKHSKRWPNLLDCRAAFVEPPGPGDEFPPVRIELSDGNSVLSDAADVDAVLSRFCGRDVELVRAAQNGYTIDQYHPDLENYDPEGHRDVIVDTPSVDSWRTGGSVARSPSAMTYGSACPCQILVAACRAFRRRTFRGTPKSSRPSPATTGSTSRVRSTPAPGSTPSRKRQA